MFKYTPRIFIFIITFGICAAIIAFIPDNRAIIEPVTIKTATVIDQSAEQSVETNVPASAKVDDENWTEKLDIYFSGREIEPNIVINNVSGKQKEISVGSHKVMWIDDTDKIKISINGDLFTVSDYETLNEVWAEGKDKVEYFNKWQQIKLYKYKGRELIGISLNFYMCTGIGCAVSYFLIYDVSTKSKNFFGTYCMGDGLKLYDFNFDDKIDYLGETFVGNRCGDSGDTENIFKLFTLSGKGKFVLQKDANKNPYSIKQMFRQNDDFETIETKIEQNWIEEIR